MNNPKFKVRFATSLARAEIEHWLNAHCGGHWAMRFVDADDHDMAIFRMVFEAVFERDGDCRTFRRALSRGDGEGMPIIASRHAFRAAEEQPAARHRH